MNKWRIFVAVGVLVTMMALVVGLTRAQAPDPQSPTEPEFVLGTTFTYQGYLSDGGKPAEGKYDFQFTLYDASSSGNQVGSILTRSNVQVSAGLFSVSLSFGSVFNGKRLWLQVAVKPVGSTGYTILTPRQEILPSPYALYTNRAGSLSAADGDPADAVTVNNDGYMRVKNMSPVRIIRYENKGDNVDFATVVSANDYYCVAAGWSTYYDIQENDPGTNMVWTYVASGVWRVRVELRSHHEDENPDIDIVCFRKEIATWEGASVTLNDPD